MDFLNEDSIEWLKTQRDNSLSTIITSIPELSEVTDYIDDTPEDYKTFLHEIVLLLAQKVRDDEFIIFIQTDRRKNGIWIDKAFEIQSIMKSCNIPLRFHKVTINKEGIDLYRVGYSHILGFSKIRTYNKRFPDVFRSGLRLWPNATPLVPLISIMEFLQKCKINHIIDPFAGYGTIGLVANIYGIHSWNIEINISYYKQMKQYYKDKLFQRRLIGHIFKTI